MKVIVHFIRSFSLVNSENKNLYSISETPSLGVIWALGFVALFSRQASKHNFGQCDIILKT